MDVRTVSSHILNGTLHDELCRVCLSPLDEQCEGVFTTFVYETLEYRVADILKEVCGIEIPENQTVHPSVCSSCFRSAQAAYHFFSKSKKSEGLLAHLVNDLFKNVESLTKCGPDADAESLFIFVTPPSADLGLDIIDMPKACETVCVNTVSSINHIEQNGEESNFVEVKPKSIKADRKRKSKFHNVDIGATYAEVPIKQEIDYDNAFDLSYDIKAETNEIDENVVLVLDEAGEPNFYRLAGENNADLIPLSEQEQSLYIGLFQGSIVDEKPQKVNKVLKTVKKKRKWQVSVKACDQCPFKCRGTAKFTQHMKFQHGVQMLVCKICTAMFEDPNDFVFHLRTHTDSYKCDLCNGNFKNRTTIINHMKRHDGLPVMAAEGRMPVCEQCGQVLPNQTALQQHYAKKHDHTKKFTCFYCSKGYKGVNSFEAHIRKHETHLKDTSKDYGCDYCEFRFSLRCQLEKHISFNHGHKRPYECGVCHKRYRNHSTLQSHERTHTTTSNFRCEICGRGFVDARALLWHQRLHANERPYTCDMCGRGFVSLNRRNQHALCAHTAPTRRCPLCPALFHLRSMVNTHIKKVHLKAHKRRARPSKYADVFWRTETVPLQELSVAVQNELLEMRTDPEMQDAFSI